LCAVSYVLSQWPCSDYEVELVESKRTSTEQIEQIIDFILQNASMKLHEFSACTDEILNSVQSKKLQFNAYTTELIWSFS